MFYQNKSASFKKSLKKNFGRSLWPVATRLDHLESGVLISPGSAGDLRDTMSVSVRMSGSYLPSSAARPSSCTLVLSSPWADCSALLGLHCFICKGMIAPCAGLLAGGGGAGKEQSFVLDFWPPLCVGGAGLGSRLGGWEAGARLQPADQGPVRMDTTCWVLTKALCHHEESTA